MNPAMKPPGQNHAPPSNHGITGTRLADASASASASSSGSTSDPTGLDLGPLPAAIPPRSPAINSNPTLRRSRSSTLELSSAPTMAPSPDPAPMLAAATPTLAGMTPASPRLVRASASMYGLAAHARADSPLPARPGSVHPGAAPPRPRVRTTRLAAPVVALDQEDVAHRDLGDPNDGVVAVDGDKLAAWIKCLCVVGFDLETGQVLEAVYPPTAVLSEAEQRTIKFTSFPDSNSFLNGDLQFSFRIRCQQGVCPSPTAAHTSAAISARGMANTVPRIDDSYLHAHVFFRQHPDASIRRGFYQKSVVVVSSLPYSGLWHRVAAMLGPVVCEADAGGVAALETAAHHISQWPAPVPGMHELPFLGRVLQCHVPQSPTAPQLLPLSTRQMAPHQVLAGTLCHGLYPTFKDLVNHLWTLWELTLMNEPIVVVSSCPSLTSAAVEGILSLVRPLAVSLDYRPYMTIQDPDFRIFTKTKPPLRAIIGVTNPHLQAAFAAWPHLVQLGPGAHGAPQSSRAAAPSAAATTPAVKTRHRRAVARDKAVLAQVAEMALAHVPDPVIDNVLRRYFTDLTARFLAPLVKYAATLWPSSLSLATAYPIAPKPFRHDQFLSFLAAKYAASPPVPTRLKPLLGVLGGGTSNPLSLSGSRDAGATGGDWTHLYRTFLSTPMFVAWLDAHAARESAHWHASFHALLCATDLARWKTGGGVARSDVADLLRRIAVVLDPNNPFPPSAEQRDQILAQAQVLASMSPAVTRKGSAVGARR
ncbi:hypothetical protein AMAG_05118 [Allomyces macrogynus ATCC 38327]|uniref:UDENN domain-containing protein n=1 Tax=Allomyces macrogynus (strain ATCC 38327) TaxID=578462 RepID=A0A0L0S7A7_ALLM3|nr:hypothetical protein AMAG_05118 [Allomyces macrogynus ATCC 38327]|eukprot:KNE58310.1 hypothetical protein AMAG_05118 [Allomyces macrogynus ATCC 38327]